MFVSEYVKIFFFGFNVVGNIIQFYFYKLEEKTSEKSKVHDWDSNPKSAVRRQKSEPLDYYRFIIVYRCTCVKIVAN